MDMAHRIWDRELVVGLTAAGQVGECLLQASQWVSVFSGVLIARWGKAECIGWIQGVSTGSLAPDGSMTWDKCVKLVPQRDCDCLLSKKVARMPGLFLFIQFQCFEWTVLNQFLFPTFLKMVATLASLSLLLLPSVSQLSYQ